MGSLSSVHHWEHAGRGPDEAKRILEPGSRVMVVERFVQPGARRHASHGLTEAQLDDVARALVEASFTVVAQVRRVAGRMRWSIVRGARPAV